MGKKENSVKPKNKIRCAYSNEMVSKHDEVIKKKYIKEYLEKCGYLVINFKFLWMFLFGIILIGSVSALAVPGDVLYFDLTERINLMGFFVFFCIALILYYIRAIVFGGLVLLILGFLLLHNGFTPVLSLLLIFGGVISFFVK